MARRINPRRQPLKRAAIADAVTKKVPRKTPRVAPQRVTMTISQATRIKDALGKAGKTYKFLNDKLSSK